MLPYLVIIGLCRFFGWYNDVQQNLCTVDTLGLIMKWPDYQGVQIFHMITYHWDHSHKYYTGVAYNICAVTKCVVTFKCPD